MNGIMMKHKKLFDGRTVKVVFEDPILEEIYQFFLPSCSIAGHIDASAWCNKVRNANRDLINAWYRHVKYAKSKELDDK